MKTLQIYRTKIYAFGSVMEGRVFEGDSLGYRFDFNGKETDKETQLQNYGMRIFNNAYAIFLSCDPLFRKYPFYSPYQFASNSPIVALDIDGLEADVNLNNNEVPILLGQSTTYTNTTHQSCHHLDPVIAKGNSNPVSEPIRKAGRIAFDIVTIAGGIFAIGASGGTATPVVTAYFITTGTMAVAGGATKLVADATGNNEASEKVPTSVSGMIALPIDLATGNQIVSGTLELIEGVYMWKPLDRKAFRTIITTLGWSTDMITAVQSGIKLEESIATNLIKCEDKKLNAKQLSPSSQYSSNMKNTSLKTLKNQKNIIPPSKVEGITPMRKKAILDFINQASNPPSK
jgi:RHS repeat-associated protein